MSSSDDKLWTIDDVAEFCQIKTAIVKRWLYTSDIPYIRLGKRHRFDPKDIILWINKRKLGYKPEPDEELRTIK